MSAFLGITLGLGCALTFAYLISQVAVRLWDHSIQDAINAYAVKKRLREIRERKAYGDVVRLPPEFFGNVRNAPGGSVARAGGGSETDAPRRNATHGTAK